MTEQPRATAYLIVSDVGEYEGHQHTEIEVHGTREAAEAAVRKLNGCESIEQPRDRKCGDGKWYKDWDRLWHSIVELPLASPFARLLNVEIVRSMP